MTAGAGAALGALSGIGLVMACLGWRDSRRVRLIDRISPYTRNVAWVPERTSVIVAVRTRLIVALDSALGGSRSVELRLARLGSGTLAGFRMHQLIWGCIAFGVSLALSLWWQLTHHTPVLALLIACVSSFISGILLCDNYLSARVRHREQQMAAELPVVADLLALTVAAGEGPVAGLERVVHVSNGELSAELARVLADIRTGTPVARAFDDLSARTGVAAIARFSEGLAVALERGSPLTDVLHAQAADVRESARRDLIEAGARKEVLMMLPVVFLLMPVTVVFAFYPGLIALHLSS